MDNTHTELSLLQLITKDHQLTPALSETAWWVRKLENPTLQAHGCPRRNSTIELISTRDNFRRLCQMGYHALRQAVFERRRW